MEILIPIILISLLVALGFLVAFIWAVRSGQYDDAETPAYRMLFDGDKPPEDKKEKLSTKNKTSTNS